MEIPAQRTSTLALLSASPIQQQNKPIIKPVGVFSGRTEKCITKKKKKKSKMEEFPNDQFVTSCSWPVSGVQKKVLSQILPGLHKLQSRGTALRSSEVKSTELGRSPA